MNRIKKELREIIDRSAEIQTEDPNHIRITTEIPSDFTGFKGHFPENPIFPGVCQIQTVIVLTENELETGLTLKNIRRAKFQSLIKPEEEIEISLEYEIKDPDNVTLEAEIYSNSQKASSIQLNAKTNRKDK